jgi:hypothetical protein
MGHTACDESENNREQVVFNVEGDPIRRIVDRQLAGQDESGSAWVASGANSSLPDQSGSVDRQQLDFRHSVWDKVEDSSGIQIFEKKRA